LTGHDLRALWTVPIYAGYGDIFNTLYYMTTLVIPNTVYYYSG